MRVLPGRKPAIDEYDSIGFGNGVAAAVASSADPANDESDSIGFGDDASRDGLTFHDPANDESDSIGFGDVVVPQTMNLIQWFLDNER